MDLVEVNFNIENRHPWETARLQSVSKLIDKHTSQKKEELNFLDVGSGDAFVAHRFTEIFKNSSAKCVDIEYDEKIIETISNMFNNPNLGLFNDLDKVSTEQAIDVVTLLDVIEHVPDDIALLKEEYTRK